MRKNLIGLVMLCLSQASASASNPADSTFDGLRSRWAGVMDEFDVPGMSVAVVKDGRIVAIETLGMRAPAGSPLSGPPTPDTMYYIASITKTYLATAICALADDGKLTLDDPVQKHLPRFTLPRTPEGTAERLTIRDLLSHRAALVDGEPIVVLDAYTGEITEDRYYTWLAKMRIKGSTTYTNIHFTLLGRVVEAASGMPWREYLDTRVLKPAGLTRTTGYASRLYGDADCALPMERVEGEWRVARRQKSDRTMHSAGGLGASANDAARWLILHMNDGTIDGTRVISAERAREMRALHGPFPEKQGSIRVMEGFGLGWQVGTFHGTPLCSHGGGFEGATAYYAMLPEKKSGFVILMNASGAAGGLLDVVAVDILDRLIDGDDRVDVLAAYRKRVADQRPRFTAQQAKRRAQMSMPFALSRPAGAYAGRFECPELGTMTISVADDRLKILAGECELDVASAGMDSFQVLGPIIEGAVFKFGVSAKGEVRDIRLQGEEESIVFQRVTR